MGADNNSNTNNSKKQQSEKADNTPFRCILSNLTGRQIRLLFWMPKKKEFEGCILKQVFFLYNNNNNILFIIIISVF